jgi:hypothetical protein
MAKQEVGLKIDVDVSSVGNMKQQLRAATNELVAMNEKFGSASKEAVAAAQKVAGLKDAIGDAKALAETFNPDRKFVALGGAVQGAAAGFSALQGAMGLFGSESKDVEKLLLKVQSAMALQQGISGIAGAIDSFKLLAGDIRGKVVTAFSTLKGAIMATGLGALAVAVATLIAYWDDLKDAIMGTNDITKAYAESQKEVTKVVGDTKTKLNEVKTALELAKDGVISKEQALNTYNKELGDTFGKATSVAMAENNMAKYTQTYLKAIELRTRAQVFYAKASEVAAKAASGEDIEPSIWQTLGNAILSGGNAAAFAGDQAKSYANNLTDLNDQQVKFTEEGNKLMKNALIEESKLTQSAQNIDNQSVKDKKNNNDEKIAFEKEYTKFLQDENERRRKLRMDDFDKERSDIDKKYADLIAKAKKYGKDTSELEALRFLETKDLINKATVEEIKVTTEANAKKLGDFSAMVPKMAAVTTTITANEAVQANTRKQIAEDEANNRILLAQSVGQTLGALSDVVGKETAAGKALAIAQATINTFLGITEVWKAKSVLPEPFNTASKVAATITTAAGGFAAVRSIARTQVPGAGGGGGVGNLTAPVAPQLSPQVTATQVNTAAVNQLGNQATRAYVLNSDIQNNDQRNAYINRNASIGNP